MHRTSRQVVASLVILALVGGALWWWLGRHPATTPAPLSLAEQIDAARQANEGGLSPEAAAAASQTAAAPFTHTYENTSYGFSFGYPDSLKAGSFTDPNTGATTITAQDATAHVGFQITVTPWGGSDAITAAQVQSDLPDIALRAPQQVVVGGVSALSFLASDPNFGDSRQVWFVYPKQGRGAQRYLYQISTYSSQDALLQKILATWKWGAI